MSSTKSRVICNETEFYYQSENKQYPIEVREVEGSDDLNSIVSINRSAFPHDNETDDYARQWIQHNWNNHYYVITYGNQLNIVGYILWVVRGGYKRRLACELEQIAIDIKHRRQGFASCLLKISLMKFQYLLQQQLQCPTSKIGIVYLTTVWNNYEAQDFYKKQLQAEQKGGKIGAIHDSNEHGDEEIIMINENMEPILEKFIGEYKNFAV